jgi:hypothetical protein
MSNTSFQYLQNINDQINQNQCFSAGATLQIVKANTLPAAIVGALAAGAANLFIDSEQTKQIKECTSEIVKGSFSTFVAKNILPLGYDATKKLPFKILAFSYTAFHAGAEILERNLPDYYKSTKDKLESLSKLAISYCDDVFDRMIHPFSFENTQVEAVGKDACTIDSAAE